MIIIAMSAIELELQGSLSMDPCTGVVWSIIRVLLLSFNFLIISAMNSGCLMARVATEGEKRPHLIMV
jgi:hypothetical protein